MRQHELEADQERAGRARRAAAASSARGTKRRRERAGDEQHLEHPLDEVQVGDAARVVLRPVPERERRLAR